jgi:hypothetical protein
MCAKKIWLCTYSYKRNNLKDYAINKKTIIIVNSAIASVKANPKIA